MTEVSTREAPAEAEVVAGPRRFSLRQRIVLRIIIAAGYWFIRLIGPTLRVCVSREEGAQQTIDQRPLIVSLWHACQIPATYVCRNIGVRVMSSNSYDGEYMGRIIRRFGFVAVKGSSSLRLDCNTETPRCRPDSHSPRRIRRRGRERLAALRCSARGLLHLHPPERG